MGTVASGAGMEGQTRGAGADGTRAEGELLGARNSEAEADSKKDFPHPLVLPAFLTMGRERRR